VVAAPQERERDGDLPAPIGRILARHLMLSKNLSQSPSQARAKKGGDADQDSAAALNSSKVVAHLSDIGFQFFDFTVQCFDVREQRAYFSVKCTILAHCRTMNSVLRCSV